MSNLCESDNLYELENNQHKTKQELVKLLSGSYNERRVPEEQIDLIKTLINKMYRQRKKLAHMRKKRCRK